MFKFLSEKKGLTVLYILALSITFIAMCSGLILFIPKLVRADAKQGPINGQYGNYPITPADNLFLQELRKYIAAPQTPDDSALIRAFTRTNFRQDAYGVILTAYQSGLPIIRAISTKKTTKINILKTALSLRTHKRAVTFSWNDPKTCRIQMDFITEFPEPVDIKTLCEQCLSQNRFEIGVDGFLTKFNGKSKYFLPGDAFRLSIYALKPAVEDILKAWRGSSENMVKWFRLRTQSFISYENVWIELYRGEPVIGNIEKKNLIQAIERAIAHTIKYQKPDGRFLYYYDAVSNSFRDHEHPNRKSEKDLYYNELRHCGGVLMLLQEYERTKNESLLEPIRRGINFIVRQIKEYRLPSGKKAGYCYYNTKAKLGGSGIALYLLAEYQKITGDNTFISSARLLHRHLLAQILPSGEFMYYAIYLNKPVSSQDNQKFFNFYYPGEAIVGLVQYVKYISQDPDEKTATLAQIKAALHFLLEECPKYYAEAYTSLPSDSWLMMGINELWDIPEAWNENYAAFVFEDSDKMLSLMYTPKNALYPDYPGSFSYQYGDLPYADAARAEGLLAATYLAQKKGETERFNTYLAALKLISWALMHLVNTPEAMYFAANQDLAVGGVRFKHTRQWFRIDTTAHAISFYLKFLPLINTPETIIKDLKIDSSPAISSAPKTTTETSRIYALQYAASAKTGKYSSLGWFTFLIQSNESNTLIDTALEYPLPKHRWGITKTQSLEARLKPLGITPDKINTIIITHAHDDHVDQLNAFPNAIFYIHRDAYATLVKSPKHKNFLKRHTSQIKTFTTKTILPIGITIYADLDAHAPGMSIVSFQAGQVTYIFPSDLCYTTTGCCAKIRGYSNEINALCLAPDKIILPHHEHYEKTSYPMILQGVYRIK